MTTITIKLISGEEWIAQRTNTLDDNLFVLSKVRKLQLVPDNKGRPALMLTPITHGNVDCDELTIEKRIVMFHLPVDAAFERQYLQEVTGIQLT